MTDSQNATPVTKPRSKALWFIIGGVVLLCCCLVIAAMIAWPTISGMVGSGLYSGLADDVLKQDVLNAIAKFESSQNGCADVSLITGTTTVRPEDTPDGSWTELWQVRACDASHLYSIEMVPSPQGGTDYTVTPLDQ